MTSEAYFFLRQFRNRMKRDGKPQFCQLLLTFHIDAIMMALIRRRLESTAPAS